MSRLTKLYLTDTLTEARRLYQHALELEALGQLEKAKELRRKSGDLDERNGIIWF